MDSHGTGERPGILGNGVESIQEVSKSIDHINDYDSLLQTNSPPATSRGAEHERDSLPEVPSIDLNRSCDAGPDGLKEQKTSMLAVLDNQSIDEHSDLYLTPEAKHQRTNLLQSSSVVEVSQLRDPSLSSSPQVQRGLDHCITAPVHRNLFLENQDAAFSRSMTERWGSPLPALKLDRLSEREKEYGHHVRLATHSNFRGFVKSAGVDFYPLGGDPRVLAGCKRAQAIIANPPAYDSKLPDNVFLMVDCPHDWLFPQCSAVVHHGGAGTTATGLKAGCPTTIVPFFGDQFFWGERIYHKGLGPAPIPISQLNIESLSEAIRFMLQPEVKSRATELAACIQNEDGVGTAVDAFHCHLPPSCHCQHLL
ncbi:UNVERIFIED_CONTAM: Sterol 3-beta-glucosyltransferase UGT80B1 [Sesamum radiatum]|uniref:Sterol 3-beta-glucosyltransferase UGT80B1 n=1 Tax=Sesamum radiatum TaxID=300843 RepID=A0AAW2M3C7_SESRA